MNHRNNRTGHGWSRTAVAASVIILLVLLRQLGFGPLLRLENYAQDLRSRQGRKANPRPELVFLGVDRGSYADVWMPGDYESSPIVRELDRNFPWSRTVWAALIEKLRAAGARVVALDFLFAAPGEGDDVLRATLTRHRDHVVLGSAFSVAHAGLGSSLVYTPPSDGLIPAEQQPAQVGFVNLWPDPDDVIRHAQFRVDDGLLAAEGPETSGLESFAAKILRKAGAGDRIPSGTAPVRFRYAGPAGTAYPYRPFHEVFVPSIWRQNYNDGEFFRDKIVVVGPAANVFHDEHLTPFESPSRSMHGPELHLQIIGAALEGEFLTQPPPTLDWIWILISGAGVGLLMTWATGFRTRVLVLAAGLVGYSLSAQALYDQANLVIPYAAPILAIGLTGLGLLGHDFARERLERLRVRRTLERYVSKDIVREVVDNRSSYFQSLEGVRKPVTILFSDVRGFTTLTEATDSTLLVKQLNEYFDRMVSIVFDAHGTLDKFIGDAVMAHWGSIVSNGREADAVRAVEAALAMHLSLKTLNNGWKLRGLPELSIGIGINHAEVIVGNLGSHQKMELTVIGDGVNLASRLEGLTKEYSLDLLLGEDIAQLVADKFHLRTVDRVRVKGKNRPVTVFTVASPDRNTPAPPWLEAHEAGVRFYRQRDFQSALAAFERCATERPNDPLTELHLLRTKTLIKSPPDNDWDGVTEMTRK